MTNIQYLGHSTFIIETQKGTILIDPYINDNPLCSLKVEDLPTIHWIFLTHGHFDHFGDTIEVAKRFNCPLVCSTEIAHLLAPYGIKTIGGNIGGFTKASFGLYKMTNAIHSSSLTLDGVSHYAGLALGFVFQIEGKTIYHAGDTALTMDMMLLEDLKIDIAILPIGGTYTMDVIDANKAIEMIKPKVAIPMHYNTFDAIKTDPSELKNPYGKVNILKPLDKISI